MKKQLLLSYLFVAIANVAFSQTAFTAGSLSVLRVGDGVSTLGSNAAPVFIDEYKIDGTLLRSVSLPIAEAGANKSLTLSGNVSNFSSFEGMLSLSPDKKNLTLAGYNAAPGTANINTSASATYNRVVGIISGDGVINTSTSLNIYNSNYICSAVTNGTDVWIAGGSANIYKTTIGAIATSPPPTTVCAQSGRSLRIFNGQLYASQSSSTSLSVVTTVGTGLPTAAGQTLAALPGISGADGVSGREFFFADIDKDVPGNDVLYVANSSSADGIAKYSLVDGSWKLSGNNQGTTTGLTGVVSGTTVTLYGIRFINNGSSQLFKLTDATGLDNLPATFNALTRSTLVSTAANKAFRGISFSPVATTTPVSLIQFNGKSTNNGIQVSWSTASEQNNSHYEIYRSADGRSFSLIGSVKGAGTSSKVLRYTFTDASPLTGTAYYKLRQVDLNSEFTDYAPIPVKSELGKSAISVHVEDNSIELRVHSAASSKGEFKIYDISGRKVASSSSVLSSGWNTITIPFTATTGTFIISAKNGTEITRKKFVK